MAFARASGRDRLRALTAAASGPLVRTDAGWLHAADAPPSPQGGALLQRAMRSRLVAGIYEDLWRPLLFTALSAGRRPSAERRRILELLDPPADGLLLDVGCGPGTLTRAVSARLGDDGAVLGIDASVAMLSRAVAASERSAAIDYLHADAASLPLPDRCADGVCCIAVLHLADDPASIVAELARVLLPGAPLVLLTSLARTGPLATATERVGGAGGVRFFGPGEIEALLAGHGLVDVAVAPSGVTAIISARRPSTA